jgi:AraC-like DNA-binding protein
LYNPANLEMNAAKTTEEKSARSLMNDQQAKREADRAQAHRNELTNSRLHRLFVRMGRLSRSKDCNSIDPPHLRNAFIVSLSLPFVRSPRAAKKSFWAAIALQYDPMHSLLATIELPIASQIQEASEALPYLSLRLDLDPTLVGSVMVEAGDPSPQRDANVKAIDVSPLDANLLDAVVRLVRLLDSPAEAHVLAPLIKREIIYRLLMGEQGSRLRHIAVLGGSTHQIARAVDRLRKDFNQPLRIESIARELGMSVSSFHHHFKSVTAMSPLQFQKQLRLQEARRLMLGQNLDATSAAYRVGYDDSSHFNREYKRLFGIPPMRDVERLREAAREIAGST